MRSDAPPATHASRADAAPRTDPLAVDCGAHTAAAEALADALGASAVERDRRGGSALAERQLVRASGLLTLAVPKRFGGAGASWPVIYRVVRRLAAADSSLAHVYGFQHLQVATILLYASARQQEHLLGETVRNNWFWGNATNPLDRQIELRRQGEHYVLDGVKTFCSGSIDADMLNVSAPMAGAAPEQRFVVAIPGTRQGVHPNADWDALGQRQTDSGSVRFDRVAVHGDEILGPPGVGGSPRATLRPLVSQLVLTEIYVGNALGALAAAAEYVRTQARPWFAADVERAVDDPFVQLRFGALWSRYQAAAVLTDTAAHRLQHAWDLGDAIGARERGETAVAVAAARVFAADAALEITSQVFDNLGARATDARHGFDRYWRNVRTHSLHDPLDYKRRDIGRWLAGGELPAASLYT
jgi:alkylation response protein AidB-like acyl-CoA dehydrogenase